MPYRKKRYKKKKNKIVKNTTYQIAKNMSGPLANRMITKMKFVEHTTLDANVGAIAHHVYRANGMFDPNYTGVGHQPYGFDQMLGTSATTGFYQKYRVLGSKITASFSSYTAGAGDTNVVGIQLVDEATPISTSTFDILEQGKSKYKIMTRMGGSKDLVKVTKGFGGTSYFGPNYKTDAIYQALYNADPSGQAYFIVFCGPINPGDNPIAINVLVTLEYIVELTEPQTFAAS